MKCEVQIILTVTYNVNAPKSLDENLNTKGRHILINYVDSIDVSKGVTGSREDA